MRTNSNTSSKNRRSFTLIEVLVTMAIFSTAIIFVFRAFTTSLDSVRLSQHVVLASELAQEKILETSLALKSHQSFPGSGSVTLENQKFDWRYELTDLEKNEKGLNLAVTWKEKAGKNQHLLEIRTLLYSN